MVIFVDPVADTIELLQPRDFNRFCIRTPAARKDVAVLQAALSSVADVADADAAWVSETALRRWSGLVDQDWWQAGLSAMIEKAAPYGWVDDRLKRIKAHIEHI